MQTLMGACPSSQTPRDGETVSQTGSSMHSTPRQLELESDLFVYFLAAVVHQQRRRILDDCFDSDDVSRIFFQAPLKLNLWKTIDLARDLRRQRLDKMSGVQAAPPTK